MSRQIQDQDERMIIRMVRTRLGYAMHEIFCDDDGTPVSSKPVKIEGMTRLDAIKYLGDVIEGAKLPAIILNSTH